MKKILIVDDSLTIRQQTNYTLTNDGYDVVEAVNGEEALKVLASDSNIGLIICDLFMPVLDGIGFVTKLHGSKSTIPVVMLTTETRASQIEKAKQQGVKAWLVKPFQPENLLAVVRQLMTK